MIVLTYSDESSEEFSSRRLVRNNGNLKQDFGPSKDDTWTRNSPTSDTQSFLTAPTAKLAPQRPELTATWKLGDDKMRLYRSFKK